MGPLPSGGEFHGVERVAGFLRGNLAGGHGVVAELFLGELMRGVTNLAVGDDAVRIEFHLRFTSSAVIYNAPASYSGEITVGISQRELRNHNGRRCDW